VHASSYVASGRNPNENIQLMRQAGENKAFTPTENSGLKKGQTALVESGTAERREQRAGFPDVPPPSISL
jgi:hypothetical protein